MTNKKYYEEFDGVVYHRLWEAKCPLCGSYIHESYPHYEKNDVAFCMDCAFIKGFITEQEYLKSFRIFCDDAGRAIVHEGKVFVADSHSKFPWEMSNNDIRKSSEYTQWRTAVFERDDYTCQRCGVRGGSLNAHHIKPFAGHIDCRFDVDNGVTLCEKCHREVHKGKDNEWLHP